MSWQEELSEKLQKGSLPEVVELTKSAVANNETAKDILGALLSGMGVIGEKFKKNEIFVPEVLIAARAMNGGLEILAPLLEESGVEPTGTVVLGTVKGDLHDIGKNLVKMMMVGAGFEVVDLGVDVSPEQFISAAKENHADIICMSALLTTTMPNMKEVMSSLESSGERSNFKVMIGGAPVTDNYAQEIGADRYTPDAATAATVAKELVQKAG